MWTAQTRPPGSHGMPPGRPWWTKSCTDEGARGGTRPSFVQAAEAFGTKEGDQKEQYNKLKRVKQRHSGSVHCDDFFARLQLAGLVVGGTAPDKATDFRILELCLEMYLYILETLSKANCRGVKKSLGAKEDTHAQAKKAYGKGKLCLYERPLKQVDYKD